MELTEGIVKRAARVGQMLAFLAALFLAVNPHPLHAQSDEAAGHSHLGSYCEAIDAEKSSSDTDDGAQSHHGDCVHHFDPLLRAPIEQSPSFLSVAAPAPYTVSTRQLILTAEPPPPRYPS